MTSWNNVGLFGPNPNAILREMVERFENSVTEGLVDKSPPTLRLTSCDERERKRRAKKLLHDTDVEIDTVVFFSNSDTADWGTAYIYEEPDDLRDIVLSEKITGESGMKASDVERELREYGYPVSKRHYTQLLEKEDLIELF